MKWRMKTPLRFGSAGNGIRTPVLLISGSSRYHWTARAPLKLDELTLLEEVLLIHSDDCFCWFIIHYAHLPPWDLNCWPQYSRVFCPGLLFRAPSSCQLSVCWRSLLLVLLGRPLFLLPCGFHIRICLVMVIVGIDTK